MFTRQHYKDWGFNTFDDYCRDEGIDPKRAQRLRRVFKVFQRELNIPISKISDVGYTNAVTVLPVIKAHNSDDWLDKAKRLPNRELKKLVDAMKPKRRRVIVEEPGSNPQFYKPETHLSAELAGEKHQPSRNGSAVVDDDEPVYEKTFYLIGDQVKVLETALEFMERRTGSSKMGYLLSSALMEFLAKAVASERGDDGQMAYYMSLLEQRYGGKVFWVKNKAIAEKLSELLKQAGQEDPAP